jgi:FtsP/CotA-like multicopper oxidase with cupredoxin domain
MQAGSRPHREMKGKIMSNVFATRSTASRTRDTSFHAPTTFSTDPSGLPECGRSAVIDLIDGASFDLHIAPVMKVIGGERIRMLAYNGSIPGPTLRVRQGSAVTVHVRNDADVEATVHWHGLRLDNAFDGVPHETQSPIGIGGEFTYQLRFPDAGLYWYHPHVREDYGLEMGLYGNLIVDAAEDDYWPAANREHVVTLDDVLIEDGKVATFNVDRPTHVAMGRFGNVMLTSGVSHLDVTASAGEVVRFFFTNTANTRLFDVALPGARTKLIGGDSGRCEHEEFVESVLLAPSERAIVDVLFDHPGAYRLEHRTPGHTYTLGTVTVGAAPIEHSVVDDFAVVRTNAEMVEERSRIEADRDRAPDKTLAFESLMPLLYADSDATATTWTCPMHPQVITDVPGVCPICGMRLVSVDADAPPTDVHGHSHEAPDGLEWEDLMPDINRASDDRNMTWKFVDRATGRENGDIDWVFQVGDRVKIRLENSMHQDHPMHHPFHVHGAGRFVVLSRDGRPDANLAWKDTVLVRAGETVDILLDVTNTGLWMAHCHIAEHNQAGMMFSFRVTEAAG